MLKRFRNEEGYSDQPSCNDVAPFLTALFDGEVDEEDARQARAHLLACERCARLWLDWNQTRSLLRNESVVAPPPTLMWRVLMAVRLSSQVKAATQKRNSERVENFVPVEAVAPVRLTHPEHVEAPRDLSARILSQTVGCEGHSHKRAPLPASHPALSAGGAHAWRRYSTAFALPVAALTLMLVSWHGSGVAPVAEVTVSPEHAAVVAQPVLRAVSQSAPAQFVLPTPQKAAVPLSVPKLAAVSVTAPVIAAGPRKAMVQDVTERGSIRDLDRADQNDPVTQQVLREASESSAPAPVENVVYAPPSPPLLTGAPDHLRTHRSLFNASIDTSYAPSQSVSAELIVTQPDAPAKLIPTDAPAATDTAADATPVAAAPDTSTDDDNRFAAVATDVDNYRSLFVPDKGVDDDHDIAG